MDLIQEWNNMNGELNDKDHLLNAEITDIEKSSKSVYLNLLKNLNAKMTWIRVLSVPMLVGAFFTNGLLQYVLLGMFISYEIGRIGLSRQLKKLPNYIDYSGVSKSMIAYQLELIKKILRMEKIWGYLFGPFAGPLGYMAFMAFKYKTLDEILLNHPNILYVLLGLTLLTIPIGYVGGLMNKYAFGKDLDKLSANLKELEKNG